MKFKAMDQIGFASSFIALSLLFMTTFKVFDIVTGTNFGFWTNLSLVFTFLMAAFWITIKLWRIDR